MKVVELLIAGVMLALTCAAFSSVVESITLLNK